MDFDFLNLGKRSFEDFDVVIFSGASGSGKSTALRYLRTAHPSFLGHSIAVLNGSPLQPGEMDSERAILFLDEITSFRAAMRVYRLSMRGKKLVVASHCPTVYFWPLALFKRVRLFRTDVGTAKLSAYLSRNSIRHSEEVLRSFVRRYDATFTDIDIILERYPGDDFDASYARFERFSNIRRARPSFLKNC